MLSLFDFPTPIDTLFPMSTNATLPDDRPAGRTKNQTDAKAK